MTATTTARSTGRAKVLAPLVVLVAAGAVTLQSGATFTSQSSNTASVVTSGTLTHSNSHADEAIFSAQGIKPGDVVDGALTITNTGSLPADFGLTEVVSTNEFAAEALTLTITDATAGEVVYTGTFGSLEDGARNGLGVIEPGAERMFRFVVELSADADNTQQGRTASATDRWDSVQLDG